VNVSGSWEDELALDFAGYLLPEATAGSGLTVDQADRFLSRLTLRPGTLAFLRTVSLLASRCQDLESFALIELPAAIRELPSLTCSVERRWEGAFQGRLQVGSTLKERLAGRPTAFVTRTRRRSFATPENIVLRAVAERLLACVTLIRARHLDAPRGWAARLPEIEGVLRHSVERTVLKEVPLQRPSAVDESSARSSRIKAHRSAAAWAARLREGLDSEDRAAIARVVAEGALVPLSPTTRFELAVLLRLARGLEAHMAQTQPDRWRVDRGLVLTDRAEVVRFVRSDDAEVRLHYNQSVLPSGACDEGVHRYLNYAGRLRPDITLMLRSVGGQESAVVIEVKLSEDRGYVAGGFHEAMLYRHEYDTWLRGWPKAILVCPTAETAPCRLEDDVVAVGWDSWPPAVVTAALVTWLDDGLQD
jgi:hypothetical protein